MQKAYDVISSWGNPFDHQDTLINLASGQECSKDIENQLINAKDVGKTALQTFLNERIYSNNVPFYDAIRKNSLKTFKQVAFMKNINANGKEVALRAERSLFGRLLVISQSQEGLTLRHILTYSLSPIPWCFGQPDGGLVKNDKSKLLG